MELDVDIFNDLKESAVRRLLRNVVTKGLTDRKSKPGEKCKDCGKSPESVDDDNESEAETEANKVVELQQASRGKPAPIPVQESDFPEGDVRRALKKMKPRGRK